MFSPWSVCLCVCQHNNVQTSKQVDETGWRCIVQKSWPSSNLGIITLYNFVWIAIMSHWNLFDHSITFARWRHIPSLLVRWWWMKLPILLCTEKLELVLSTAQCSHCLLAPAKILVGKTGFLHHSWWWCYRNTVAPTVQQELLYVGDEDGKLLAIHDIIRKVRLGCEADDRRSKFVVQETRTRILVQEICLCVISSRTSFFSYEKLGWIRTLLYSVRETWSHVIEMLHRYSLEVRFVVVYNILLLAANHRQVANNLNSIQNHYQWHLTLELSLYWVKLTLVSELWTLKMLKFDFCSDVILELTSREIDRQTHRQHSDQLIWVVNNENRLTYKSTWVWFLYHLWCKLDCVCPLVMQGFQPPMLVFVQSKERAKDLFHELVYDGINVDVIHADRTQQQVID